MCAAGFQVARKVASLLGGAVPVGPATSTGSGAGTVGKAVGEGKRGCALIVDYGDDKVFGASFRVRFSSFP